MKKKRAIKIISLFCLLSVNFAFAVTTTTQPVPEFKETKEAHEARMKWFRDAKFGMFIHWGLYSQLAGEWNDKTVTGGAEWIQQYLSIPSSQYSLLAKTFSAKKFNADEWVKSIANAGVKYICITTKHHDGFCMWPTKMNDNWNITKTPYKKDVIKELSEACKRNGVTFCIYHSILDWHHEEWPGRPTYNDYAKNVPDKEKFKKYLYGQLKELFSNYGNIGMIWLDGSWDREHWTSDDGKQLEDYIRSLQPTVIINNRSGYLPPQPKLDIKIENEYSYIFAGDYISPEGEVPATGLPGIDWETCQTMQLPNNWGYNRLVGFRSFVDLQHQLVDVVSKGGNMLLNIGPTGEGAITPQALSCLEKIGEWMKTNSASIHGTTANPFETLSFDGRCTQKPGKLYLHIFAWPKDSKIRVAVSNKINRAYMLSDKTKQALNVISDDKGCVITLPSTCPDPVDAVLVVELDGTQVVII